MNCSKITGNLQMASCRNAVAGIKGEAIIINFDDWKAATITELNGVISAIALAGATKASKFTSHEKAFESSSNLQKGTYNSSFAHQIIMRAFDRTQTLKDDINKMANGRYVAIIINRDQNDEPTTVELLGAENGLVANAIEHNSADNDGVAYAITLGSEEGAYESEIPKSVYTNSLAATLTMIEALCAAS
jgi:hypothetical protein